MILYSFIQLFFVFRHSIASTQRCVFEAPRWHKQGIAWNRSKEQALNAMRRLLSEIALREIPQTAAASTTVMVPSCHAR